MNEGDGHAGYALVVDDHPLVMRGVAGYLSSHCGYAWVHCVAGGAECLAWIARHGQPELVIVDFWLADGSALDLLKTLSAARAAANVLVMSGDDGVGIASQVRAAGARGFIHKNDPPETFARAVRAVRRGKTWFTDADGQAAAPGRGRHPLQVSPVDLGLTRRQGEVLAMMLRGLPNKRIASALNVTEQTVKEHITAILQRLGVSNRIEVITLLHGRALRL
ncbi:DNA-binding response regulator [Alcanivorax sp. N3-2A]|nr:DNA-binding response regulator [Alcanivorax sp. N3-2A]|tara:strand:- start:2782 stop:3444 length:663 start_codon:yes stop_codon:yes gene_type:complete